MPVIALLFLGCTLFFAAYTRQKFGKNGPWCLFLIACLICEVFFFNFETFRSATYPEIEDYTISYSEGVDEYNGSYTLSGDTNFLDFSGFDAEVENIHIKTNTTSHTVRFFVSDEANENRYHAGDRTISRFTEATSYIKTNFTGKANQIRIYIPDIGNRIVTLSDIEFNCHRPMFFSPARVIFCFLFLCFIYYLIMRKDLWTTLYNHNDKSQRNTTITVAVIMALLFLFIAVLNPGFVSPGWAHHNQYNELAEAFLKGQLHLDKEVPEVLLEMENPYDRYARKEALKEAGVAETWDTAFYNGKFYVYFGVLPALLFNLPAKLLFNADFPNFLAIVIFSWVLIAGIFLLYGQLLKKHFTRIPYLMYIVLSLTTCLTGGVVYIIKRPDFYSIPIIGALAFSVMGFYFWLSAMDSDKLSRAKLCIGSVFMASVIALRPNLIFFSCAAFVIFWNSVFRDRELLSINSRLSDEKYRGIKNTIAFCAPYIVIGVLVMIYNYLRFDSPFDFGAAYNLTTSDMTKRGFALDRWGLGIFEYLINPPQLSATFPYLTSSYPSTTYIGFTSREGMFGGILVTQPVIWSLFAMHKTRKQAPFKFAAFLFATGFITCLVDIQAGGILPRYTCDFAVFFVLAAVLTLFMLYEQYPSISTKFASWALLCMIIFDILLIIAGGSSTLQTMNTPIYMKLYSAFAFFL